MTSYNNYCVATRSVSYIILVMGTQNSGEGRLIRVYNSGGGGGGEFGGGVGNLRGPETLTRTNVPMYVPSEGNIE